MRDGHCERTTMRSFALRTLLILCSVASASAESPVNWTGFRGAGDSHVTVRHVPVTWEPRGGRRGGNWTIRLPGYGQSSPVVWGDQIFVTAVSGTDKEHLHVLAIDLQSGQTRWQKDFAGTQRVPDGDAVSRAAPTPVIDAEHCYVMFESGDLFALTHAGELVWQRSIVKEFGEFQGPHGYGSSPILADGKLVVQVCHNGPSYLLAIDRMTGKDLWKVDHPSETGWSTPAAYRRGETNGIVVSSSGSVRAYDVRDGRELWFVTGIRGNSTASPSIADDVVVIGGGSDRMGPPLPEGVTAGSLAIRLGGSGDVSATHVLWKSSKVSSGYASPLVHEGRAWFVNRVGGVQCVDIVSGNILGQTRLPGTAWASPLWHRGKLFFFGKDGAVTVLADGPELQEIGESQLAATDVVYGVAAVEGAWIVRTGRGLLRIGEATQPTTPDRR